MLRNIHKCRSTEPYFTVEVPSQSKSDMVYEVYSIFPDDPPEEYICVCPGFNFRGRCAHQEIACADRCLWEEGRSREQQTPEQRSRCVCPRCGQETYTQLVMEDDQHTRPE